MDFQAQNIEVKRQMFLPKVKKPIVDTLQNEIPV